MRPKKVTLLFWMQNEQKTDKNLAIGEPRLLAESPAFQEEHSTPNGNLKR